MQKLREQDRETRKKHLQDELKKNWMKKARNRRENNRKSVYGFTVNCRRKR